jgi:hypothetical protein
MSTPLSNHREREAGVLTRALAAVNQGRRACNLAPLAAMPAGMLKQAGRAR